MPIELTAHTDAGARLVAIAEELSQELAARAAEHDRDGTYPFEAIDALKAAGYFAAPVSVELGGLGVWSAHDLVVASSRLARGDASVAIGVNMHLVAVLNMERRRQIAVAAGAQRRARAFASSLQQIARNGVVLAAAISERGQDLTRPGTLASRTESGWRIDGRKLFCTMSPAATDLYVAVTYADSEGTERYAYAMVPTGAPGVVINDDWDALGMRASGSNSISLEGVELPESGVRGGFRAGDPLPYMERNLVAGLFHAAASLGIAESADQVARRGLAGRINGDARPRMQVADNAVKAGSFMHPLGANRAYDYLANVALGEETSLH
jgi:alkylation response protein AidB-like acyl-CoA dehydrogenase